MDLLDRKLSSISKPLVLQPNSRSQNGNPPETNLPFSLRRWELLMMKKPDTTKS